jgi:hypothetical protein
MAKLGPERAAQRGLAQTWALESVCAHLHLLVFDTKSSFVWFREYKQRHLACGFLFGKKYAKER